MRLKGHRVSDATVQALEAGKTAIPTPEVLRAMADVYRKPYAELAAVVARHYYALGRDLLGSADLVQPGGTPAGGHAHADPLATETHLLEEIGNLERQDRALRERVRALSVEILAAVVTDDRSEDRADSSDTATPRRRSRRPRR